MNILKGWRTRALSLILLLLGAVEALDPNMVASVLPTEYRGWAFIVIALAVFALRQITTTAPGQAK